uniref:FYVE-type domain-containing protein n=1 Tax=Hyaloperonospora arabidopsidis (strain Emoy2) TaxID=559515 RepID=M4BZW9_HYAAE
MKFPLPKNLFPPLELSSAQEHDFEQLANTLIKATLGEYDRFARRDHKRVDARRWKPIRTRDGVSIYQERTSDADVCQQTPTSLALYQSTLSTTSSRPSQPQHQADRSTGLLTSTLSAGTSQCGVSVNSAYTFGPASPRKTKSFSDMDTQDTSLDRTGNNSYSSCSGDGSFEPHVTTAAFSGTKKNDNSGLPRLLAVGTLRGSLDDVMYGVVSPNASSVRLRSSYLDEHIADCAVLREIKGPSAADPFSFLGIKWLVRAKHRGAARIVLPRDFVVLEFSGVMMRPDNSRVGFHLMHSVQLPTCRELQEHRIVRAKVSSCYIFEETCNNLVQMFMTASVDPRGHVLDRMAVRSAATALSNCWKSVSCAHNKKLAFCLQNERPSAANANALASSYGSHARGSSFARSSRCGMSALRPVNESSVHETMEPVSQRSDYGSTTRRRQCGVCRGKLGKLSKTLSCQLCCDQICSRCRVVRKLSSNTLNAQITQSAIDFCKKCVASVGNESALEIARQELWVRTQGRTRLSSGLSTAHARSSFSQEKSTYATVVLGRSSDTNSRGSGATSCFSYGRDLDGSSRSRNPQYEESSLGYSVGPRLSTSTQSSTPLQLPSSLTKHRTRSTLSMSTDRLSGATMPNDSLSLTDLGMGENSKGAVTAIDDDDDDDDGKEEARGEQPVVLDHRMTLTIRSLRHLDYVLSVGEQDLVNELESEDIEDYSEFEFEGRSSYASSVAVLDDDYEVCETPRSEATRSQRESPIVEGDEGEKHERETASDPAQSGDEQQEEEEDPAECCLQDGNEEVPAEEDNRTVEPTQGGTEVAGQQVSDDNHTSAQGDGDDGHESEDDVMLMTQLDLQKGKSEPDIKLALDQPQPHEHRAHKTVSSEETATNQHHLFQRMQDLHNVVESTYQVARANTEAALKKRDSGRVAKPSLSHAAGNLRGVRTFSQPFAFNVVGLRSTRAMTVGIGK